MFTEQDAVEKLWMLWYKHRLDKWTGEPAEYETLAEDYARSARNDYESALRDRGFIIDPDEGPRLVTEAELDERGQAVYQASFERKLRQLRDRREWWDRIMRPSEEMMAKFLSAAVHLLFNYLQPADLKQHGMYLPPPSFQL